MTKSWIQNLYTIGNFFTFETPFQVHEDSLSLLIQANIRTFFPAFDYVTTLGEPTLEVSLNQTLQIDEFRIDTRKGHISIQVNNLRAIHYAIQSILFLGKRDGFTITLPSMILEDYPDTFIRGIIEGYYGTPWTKEERWSLDHFMIQHRLNTYMYAPKMDLYHRNLWRESYPEDKFHELTTFFHQLQKAFITPWFCMSPSYHAKESHPISYSSKEDFQCLVDKYQAFYDQGIRHFGILYDDIDAVLSVEDLAMYERVGLAHAGLANRLREYFAKFDEPVKWVLCPTEYHELADSPYRMDLRSSLHPEIEVFFTGDNVVAEVITTADLEKANTQFGRKVMIWDNFPVSDFTYGVREYTNVIQNRSTSLPSLSSGYLINPSIHFELSKIGMISMAQFSWNAKKYDSLTAYQECFDQVDPRLLQVGKAFFQHNRQTAIEVFGQREEEQQFSTLSKDTLYPYYQTLATSVDALCAIDSAFTTELKPWLLRTKKEITIVYAYLNQTLTKDMILSFLEDIHFCGSRIIDFLIKATHTLTEEEYTQLITKKRGNEWYRVFEKKRWQK